MPRRRRGNGKRKFACNHIGKGGWCHRCEAAEKLEEVLKSGKQYTTHNDKKKYPKPKVWTNQEVKDEITNLKKVLY